MTYRAGFLRGRAAQPADDSGNIAMLMLVILVGATIGSLLLAMIVNQFGATRFSASRVRTLNAAQAGMDVMLGQIRAAQTGSDAVSGDPTKLPCNDGVNAPAISGAVQSTISSGGTPMYYRVTVQYYLADPATGAAPALACAAGYGPYFGNPQTQTPLYAQITSLGCVQGPIAATDTGCPNPGVSGSSTGRTLHETYAFRTQLNQVKGGLLHVGGSCLAAASTSPAFLTNTITPKPCNPSDPTQLWAYNSNLSISLTATATSSSAGLCIDTGGAVPTTAGATSAVNLQTCSSAATYPQQMFALAAGPYFMATASDGRTYNHEYNPDLNNVCLSTSNGPTLALINTGPCSTISPDANAGAGPAGTNTAQLVNYALFGRCLDVNGSDYPGTLIGYTCTVETPVAKTPGNERWHFGTSDPATTSTAPVVGSIWSYRSSTPYHANPDPPLAATDGAPKFCMTSSGTVGGSVLMTACSNSAIASPPPSQTWTVYRTTSLTNTPLSYGASYQIVDSSGLCMAEVGSSIVMQTCSSSLAQKWNADPNVLASRLTNTGEN